MELVDGGCCVGFVSGDSQLGAPSVGLAGKRYCRCGVEYMPATSASRLHRARARRWL